jgi:hypothetical protein
VIRLVRAEFLKLRTTQVWFWLLLASVALTVLSVVGQIAGTHSDVELQVRVRDVLVSAHTAYIALFVLGVLAVTTEFRYQTITPTLLATPARWAVVAAKSVTYAVAGLGYVAVCLGVQFAIALPWLSARGITVPGGDITGAVAADVGVVVLMSLVGLGAGALMKNQIVAVSVGLVVVLVLENLLLLIPVVRHVYPYLPGGAINGLTARQTAGDRSVNGVQLLSVWASALTLFLWALVMAVAGAGITMNRDIT